MKNPTTWNIVAEVAFEIDTPTARMPSWKRMKTFVKRQLITGLTNKTKPEFTIMAVDPKESL